MHYDCEQILKNSFLNNCWSQYFKAGFILSSQVFPISFYFEYIHDISFI